MTEIGLYVHIPYCVKKCYYCAFNSYEIGRSAAPESYLSALQVELAMRAGQADGRVVRSVFLGGGTPTIYPAQQLGQVLEQIRRHFKLSPGAEITVEANPGTVGQGTLQELLQQGFNRISFGGQALQPHLLRSLGRIHAPEEIRYAALAAKRAGFGKINVDLMYGLPRQSLADWQESLIGVLELGIDHLSLYGLSVEENTVFYTRQQQGRLALPSEELEVAQGELAYRLLERAGFDRYEISAYGKNGSRCWHNLNYWRRGQYLAVGAGAHGFLNEERYWNLALPEAYMAAVTGGRWPTEGSERLNVVQAMEEWVALHLRLLQGFDPKEFLETFGCTLESAFPGAWQTLAAVGLLSAEPPIRMTPRGLWLYNRVCLEFVGHAA